MTAITRTHPDSGSDSQIRDVGHSHRQPPCAGPPGRVEHPRDRAAGTTHFTVVNGTWRATGTAPERFVVSVLIAVTGLRDAPGRFALGS
ncbi:MAG: hypothetical protein ACR2GH_13075 [Pseudonocardia sp.]